MQCLENGISQDEIRENVEYWVDKTYKEYIEDLYRKGEIGDEIKNQSEKQSNINVINNNCNIISHNGSYSEIYETKDYIIVSLGIILFIICAIAIYMLKYKFPDGIPNSNPILYFSNLMLYMIEIQNLIPEKSLLFVH